MTVLTYLFQLGCDISQRPVVTTIQSCKIIPEIWEFRHCFSSSHRHKAKLGGIPPSENNVHVSTPMRGGGEREREKGYL